MTRCVFLAAGLTLFASSSTALAGAVPTPVTVVGLADSVRWQTIEPGLELALPRVPPAAACAESTITVIRIDPARYELVLLCASEHDGRRLTGREWCAEFGLSCATNASMYGTDYLTSTGYMRAGGHVNNGAINGALGAIMAFDALDGEVPRVQIIDRYEQDWKSLMGRYGTLVQNYRIISTRQKNQWQAQDKIYSTAAVAMDNDGRILFIFSRAPYSTRRFGELLLALPLSVYNAMYCEGGPEAFLFCSEGDVTLDRVGSYETGFYQTCINQHRYAVPNVIGARRREEE